MPTTKPFRIGFVDKNLANFHADTFLSAMRKELAHLGAEVTGCTGLEETPSRAWAAKNQVAYFPNVAELDAQVDAYMVLAPSNPETHEGLCREVLLHGKPTYVDKTFAPDLATAQRIFALADHYRAPIQTSSALRYTGVQRHVAKVGADQIQHLAAFAGGSSFAEYGIHPLELAVSCMGPKAHRVRRFGDEAQTRLRIEFSQGRTADVNLSTRPDAPYAAAVTDQRHSELVVIDLNRMFTDTVAEIVGFLISGLPRVDRCESLLIRRILDVVEKPEACSGFVALDVAAAKAV